MKLNLTKKQVDNLAYALEYYLEAIEEEEGVGHERNSCQSILSKLK